VQIVLITPTRSEATMQTDHVITAHELDSRTSDGIHVQLLWLPAEDHLVVAVSDHRTGTAFVVGVDDRSRALDAFRHPYAYAAWQGVDTSARPPVPRPDDDQLASGGETQVGVRSSDS
jgi:hypothetical protein